MGSLDNGYNQGDLYCLLTVFRNEQTQNFILFFFLQNELMASCSYTLMLGRAVMSSAPCFHALTAPQG